jgi:hypothetical protein
MAGVLRRWKSGSPISIADARKAAAPKAAPLAKVPTALGTVPPPTPAPKTRTPLAAALSTKVAHYDVGGHGRCAEFALADQIRLITPQSPTSAEDLRKQAVDYLNKNIDTIVTDNAWMGLIESALLTAIKENALVDQNVSSIIAKKQPMTDTDCHTLVTTYSQYTSGKFVEWDHATFKALAAASGRQIAVIQSGAPTGDQITSLFPNNRPIDPETTLFIWYNKPLNTSQAGTHYHSVTRTDPALRNIIQRREESVLRTFLDLVNYFDSKDKSRTSPENQQKAFQGLKTSDPRSYAAICHLVWQRRPVGAKDDPNYGETQLLAEGANIRDVLSSLDITQESILQERQHFVIEKDKAVRR